MENDLVEIKRNKAMTTSLEVAKIFGKRHDHILRDIENLKKDVPNFGEMFVATTHKDNYERNQKMYFMNRDGFSLLVMGFTGKEALQWKLKYINAFNTMESMLKERNTEAWIEQRSQGKLVRKDETNIIQQLIDYAKSQGSNNSDKLYMVYTKLANKMSGIEDRDTANIKNLNALSFIETIILNEIREGIEKKIDYHIIYQNCKKHIELFKDVAYLN